MTVKPKVLYCRSQLKDAKISLEKDPETTQKA